MRPVSHKLGDTSADYHASLASLLPFTIPLPVDSRDFGGRALGETIQASCPVDGGMAAGTVRLSPATKSDMEDASSQPSSYMLGLSEQVASMADAVLIMQVMELPVHTYILAANSPVFADILEAPPTEPPKSQSHSIRSHWKETACQLCAQP